MGRTYEATARWDQAIEAYERAVYFTADYLIALLRLGELYLKMDRKKDATEHLQVVLEKDPGGLYAEQARNLLKQHGLYQGP
jgi:tetratricopeptide (TPR) repeat protein